MPTRCEFEFEDMYPEFAPEPIQCGRDADVHFTVVDPMPYPGDDPEIEVHMCAEHAAMMEAMEAPR